MRLTLLALAAALTLTLTACSDGLDGGVSGGVESTVVDLPGGGEATCVVYDGRRAGGIACDFPEPKPTPLVMQSPTVDPRP